MKNSIGMSLWISQGTQKNHGFGCQLGLLWRSTESLPGSKWGHFSPLLARTHAPATRSMDLAMDSSAVHILGTLSRSGLLFVPCALIFLTPNCSVLCFSLSPVRSSIFPIFPHNRDFTTSHSSPIPQKPRLFHPQYRISK